MRKNMIKYTVLNSQRINKAFLLKKETFPPENKEEKSSVAFIWTQNSDLNTLLPNQ